MSRQDIDYPFHVGGRGRTATTEYDEHVHDMLEQLIFTNPGERVNRPDLGSGVLQLVFSPNSPELAAALQFTLKAAVQHWLGDLIDMRELEVVSLDSALTVDVQYAVRATGTQRAASFKRSV